MKLTRVYVYEERNIYCWVFKHDSHLYIFKHYVSQSISMDYLISLIQETEIKLVPIPNN